MLLEGAGNCANELTVGDPADRETRWDIRSLKLIVNTLREKYPDDGIMGEGLRTYGPIWNLPLNDRGFFQGTSGRVWVIDPICGSTAFACGLPQWIVSLGLVTDTDPVKFISGIIYDPNQEELFFGHGPVSNGSWMISERYPEGKLLQVAKFDSRERLANSGLISAEQRVLRENPYLMPTIELSREFGGLISVPSCGLPMCDVAAGRAAVVVKGYQPYYDYAGAVRIVKGAGGTFADWHGNPWTMHELRSDLKINFVCYNGQKLVKTLIDNHIGHLADYLPPKKK
jgi:myo-inositol-1(or 4)-monophosphatase